MLFYWNLLAKINIATGFILSKSFYSIRFHPTWVNIVFKSQCKNILKLFNIRHSMRIYFRRFSLRWMYSRSSWLCLSCCSHETLYDALQGATIWSFKYAQIWSWDMNYEGVKKMRLLDLIHSEPFFCVMSFLMWCHFWLNKRFHSVTICFWIGESVYYYYITNVCLILPMIHWGLSRRIKTTIMICVIKAESLQPTWRRRERERENHYELI